jgi:predicted acetyltransferase
MPGAMRQPHLTAPSVELQASFLSALVEYHVEGMNLHLDVERLADGAAFERFVAALRLEASDVGAALRAFTELGAMPYPDVDPRQYVPETVLWWVAEDDYLGRIAIRHRLNASLLRRGGNIGYDVRPSARRQGHAGAMLAAALPVAAGLGIARARIDCDVANIASRRVIEKNGGLLEKEERGSLYFWVPTGGDCGLTVAPGADGGARGERAAPGPDGVA